MAFNGLYILDGANCIVPCEDIIVWSRWARSNLQRRTLAETEAGDTLVRTTFMGIDCQVKDDGPPLTFNSEVFCRRTHRKMERFLDLWMYTTYNQAMEGHAELVESFKAVSGIVGVVS